MAKPTLLIVTFAMILFTELVSAVNIQFYGGSNFTQLIYQSNSTAKCNNMPEDKRETYINSIKTDTCLMVYSYLNCQAASRKFDPDNRFRWFYYVRSFHTCNEEIGGHQLNIDITKWYNLDNRPTDIPDVLESHKNVCTCVNIPKYVQSMEKWSINNHGNELLAYYEPDCSETKWRSDFIPGGHWESAHPNTYVKTDEHTKLRYKIHSLGPDPKSKYFNHSCSQGQNAEVSKVHLEEIKIFPNISVNNSEDASHTLPLNNDTKPEYTLEGLIMLMHSHDLRITKKIRELEDDVSLKFADIEEINRNLTKIIDESAAKVHELETKAQKHKFEMKNLTDKIRHDFNELFA